MQQVQDGTKGGGLAIDGYSTQPWSATPAVAPPGGEAMARARGPSESRRGHAGASTPEAPPAGPRTRRWTVNGDFLSLKPTGIARFAREVTGELDALLGAGHPLTRGLQLDLVTPTAAGEQLRLAHIEVSRLPELRPRLPQVWVQAQLPRHVHGGLLSFCNLAPVRADRHIVCIHDLQTRTTPSSYSWPFRLAHRLILPRLARHADVVTTVSAYSKATFVGFGLCSSSKIVVVPNGCDHALRWRADRATVGWRRERPFVLCMGRNEAHKNTELAWRIAGQLDALGIDLVVVGDFDPAPFDARCGGRPANLRCHGRVGDDDLARGFAEALCFLFPSRTEGFGLPALEAMACGCPVVASLSPAVMEACGGAALYVDADDVPGWAEVVSQLSRNPDLAPQLRLAGEAQARRFTWRGVAIAYLRLMATVDAGHARNRQPADLAFAACARHDARPHAF